MTDLQMFRPVDEYLHTALADLIEQYGIPAVLTELGVGVKPVPSSPSRVTDPDTAQAAGNRVRTNDVGRFSIKSRQAKLLFALEHRPMTAQEAARAVLGDNVSISAFEGCRRRMSDLLAAGYVRDSGDRRSNPGSPDEAIVWAVTMMEGRSAILSLRVTGWSR